MVPMLLFGNVLFGYAVLFTSCMEIFCPKTNGARHSIIAAIISNSSILVRDLRSMLTTNEGQIISYINVLISRNEKPSTYIVLRRAKQDEEATITQRLFARKMGNRVRSSRETPPRIHPAKDYKER